MAYHKECNFLPHHCSTIVRWNVSRWGKATRCCWPHLHHIRDSAPSAATSNIPPSQLQNDEYIERKYRQQQISVNEWGAHSSKAGESVQASDMKSCGCFVISWSACQALLNRTECECVFVRLHVCVCSCVCVCAYSFFWPSRFLCRVYCTTDSWRGRKRRTAHTEHTHADVTVILWNNKRLSGQAAALWALVCHCSASICALFSHCGQEVTQCLSIKGQPMKKKRITTNLRT